MSHYLNDTEIELDEYAFKTIPGLVLYNAWLSIGVDRSNSINGEWYYDSLTLTGFSEGVTLVCKKGDWLFDTLCKELSADHGWEDRIARQCADLD